jgi:SpoVK/Ycf46/Vps4 family AAA+-type ATPase
MSGFLTNLFQRTHEAVIRQQQQSGSRRNEDEANRLNWAFLGFEVLKFAVSIGVIYYATSEGLRIISSVLNDPSKQTNALTEKKILAKRLKRPEIEIMDFDAYELRLIDSVVGEEELDVTFKDIGGLEDELEEVHDNVVLPIKLWKANQVGGGDRPLMCPLPTGIMLFGLPGTGKSLIGKAIAKECGATFINIKASAILDKFVGESDKLAAALFRLGRKLGPSIIFIDEIETLLRKRESDSASGGNSVIQTLQGVFLSEWDGLSVDRQDNIDKTGKSSSSQPPIVILGATNRPLDIDPAFLRRMPVRIQTKVPNTSDRIAILKAMLKKEASSLSSDVDLQLIAEKTEGCTGSDLRELVRVAVLQREKQRMESAKVALEAGTYAQTGAGHHHDIPALTMDHFRFALLKHKKAVQNTASFNAKIQRESDEKTLRLFRALGNNNSNNNRTNSQPEDSSEDSQPEVEEIDN